MMMTMMILLQSRENYNTMLGVLLGGLLVVVQSLVILDFLGNRGIAAWEYPERFPV